LRVLALRAVLALHPQGVRRLTLALRAVLALCLLLALGAPAAADTLHGVVIVVIDGDTVLFKPDHYSPGSRAFMKLRLADIDAPEQGHRGAATRLKTLVLAVAVDGRDDVAAARGRSGGALTQAELVRQVGLGATRSWRGVADAARCAPRPWVAGPQRRRRRGRRRAASSRSLEAARQPSGSARAFAEDRAAGRQTGRVADRSPRVALVADTRSRPRWRLGCCAAFL
jgi:hypothetical protein